MIRGFRAVNESEILSGFVMARRQAEFALDLLVFEVISFGARNKDLFARRCAKFAVAVRFMLDKLK